MKIICPTMITRFLLLKHGIRLALSDDEQDFNNEGFVKLKSFIFLMALITLDSFAITGRDSWGDVRRSGDVMIQQPTFAGIFGPEGLFNACTTDDEFKSIRPVKNCVEYREVVRQSERGSYKDYICAAYESKQVSMSRTYIQNVCVRHAPMRSNSSGECVQYDSVTSVYPTTFSFAVIEASGEAYGNYLFSKTFALQSCD